MKCPNCGKDVPSTAKFCESCGSPVVGSDSSSARSGRTAPVPQAPGPDARRFSKSGAPQSITRNIVLSPDGKYRWHYERGFLGSLGALLDLWGIVLVLFLAFTLLQQILYSIQGIFSWTELLDALKTVGIALLVAEVVCTIGFLIYAAVRGKKILSYEMDARRLSQVFGNSRPPKDGTSQPKVTKSTLEFDDLSTVKAYPKRDMVELRRPLKKRMYVYADDQDFDFLVNYLKTHVKKRCRVIEG